MQFFSVGYNPTDDIQYSKDTENQIFLLILSSLPPLCVKNTVKLLNWRHENDVI